MCREEIFQNVIAVSNRKLCTRPFPEQKLYADIDRNH